MNAKQRVKKQTGKNDNGAAAVEFAMIVPVFFLLFFGIMEYGWLMTQEILLTHAVSEGAREALREPDAGKRTQVVREKVKSAFGLAETFSGTPLGDGDISVIFTDSPRQVTVQVADFTYTPLVGFTPTAMVPESIHATATFTYPQ